MVSTANVAEVYPLAKLGMASQRGILIAKLTVCMHTHFLEEDTTEFGALQHITVHSASGDQKMTTSAGGKSRNES